MKLSKEQKDYLNRAIQDKATSHLKRDLEVLISKTKPVKYSGEFILKCDRYSTIIWQPKYVSKLPAIPEKVEVLKKKWHEWQSKKHAELLFIDADGFDLNKFLASLEV